uniref:Copia protein n=1 Tax=Tanacetum cinerariifolium TaxID=118510 RepID=A0A699HBV2_TANCI|nr:copia protein [Tanacetum cinerariifolium]
MERDDNNGDHPETSNTSPPVPSPTQQIPHTVSSIKLPILKKQVIHNGNGHVIVTIDTNRMIKLLPPKTVEEVVARQRERKARTTLLMALPKYHLAKFHKMADVKEMWEAIKSRFEIHGAGVSHEDANQKFLRPLPSFWSHVALIMRNKPGLDTLSFDDLYNNLRVFKCDVKGSTVSSSNTSNVAFVSTKNTSRTNDVSTAYSVSSPSVLKSQNEGSSSYTDEVAMISIRIKKFHKRTGRKLQFDTKDLVGFDKTKVECFNCHKIWHFARDCRAKGKQDSRRRDVGYNKNKTRENGNYMPSGPDVEIDYSKFTYGPKQNSADESDSKPCEYASCESDSSVATSTSMPEAENIKETSTTDNNPKIEKQDRNSTLERVWDMLSLEKHALFVDDPHRALKDKGIIYSGCSRGSNGRITGKEKIKTSRLDFEYLYYMEELKHYNLFFVSQMYDKKNKVLFTDTDCLVLSPNFKLPDENQKGKQHKASCKAKIVSSVNRPLQILHMEFFGPTSAEVVNTAYYVLNKVLVTKPQNKIPYELLTENQANKSPGPKEANNSAGTQANDDQGASSKEIDHNEEHFVLPIWSAYSTTVKRSGDKIEKNTGFKTYEKLISQVEQVFLEELEKLKRHEKEANGAAESLRKEDTHDIQNASTSSTNIINTASTPLSTAGPSRAFNDGELSYLDPSKYDLLDDHSMPYLKDIYASPSEGIFTYSSYDNESVATDFNNLETTMKVSPTPITRIHTIHPKTQILRDPNLAVQTRSKVNKNYEAHTLVWILVDLPFKKKAIGTKWIYKNKKDEKGIVVRNKARLVTYGHRQEEGIDYDEVFADVASIDAISIFLAFTSYMGFIFYQMDAKSTFLFGTINEEVYVAQPLGYVEPKFPNKVYKVMKALCGLHQAPRACVKTASTPIETQKPLVKDEEAGDVDVLGYSKDFTSSSCDKNL